MDKKYQLKTLFNGIELPLDDLEQLRLTPSLSQSMTRYQVLNFSLCIPHSFNVLVNTDGYDLIAYHPVYSYDYHIAPIIVTVNHEDVSALQLGSDLNQFTFMELILESLQSPLNFIKLEEYNVDGYEAVKVEQSFTELGKKQIIFLWMMNQTLVKVAVSFNEVLDYSDELTHFIIQNFKVNELKRQDEADAVVQDLEKILCANQEQEEGEAPAHLEYIKELNLVIPSSDQTDATNSQLPIFHISWKDEENSEFINSDGKSEKGEQDSQLQTPTIHQTFSLDEWLQVVGQMAAELAKRGTQDDELE